MSIGPRYVGDQELPWPEGTHSGPDCRPQDANVDYGNAHWSLTGLVADYVLFSAVSLVAAGMPKDPVALYWSEEGLPDYEAPLWVDIGRVVLAGLPKPYDEVLFACPKERATGLIRFLDRVSIGLPDGQAMHSIRQTIPIVDWPLLVGVSVAPPRPPVVPVELYGIDAPTVLWGWMMPRDPWKEPVTLKRRIKPQPKVKTKGS